MPDCFFIAIIIRIKMGGISWFIRGSVALIFTLANTVGMGPFWFCKGILIWSKNPKISPNPIQWFLTFMARSTLFWLAKVGCQPDLNTRTPSKLRDWLLCRRFAWIQPAKVKMVDEASKEKFTFDDSSLPVRLRPQEITKRSAGLWYLNPCEKYVTGQLQKATRKTPVLLYFRKLLIGCSSINPAKLIFSYSSLRWRCLCHLRSR